MQNESDMLKQVAQAKEEARAAARGEKPDEAEELPQGSSPIEEGEETSIEARSASEEASEGETEGDAEPEKDDEDEGPVRIGDQTFSSAKEAIRYAEQLEREKLTTDAHAAGIREALEATRVAAKPEPEPEDDFEQRFYSNPKEELRNIRAQATQDALATIRAETQREKMWNDFLNEHPDIRRKDAQRILDENWDTIGKITDLAVAQKTLARKVRDEYAEINALTKPRTELGGKKQTVSPAGGRPPGVTQTKKDERPLSFAQQLRKMRQTP